MMVKLLQGRSAFELEVEFKSEYEFQLAANVLQEKINNNNNNNNNNRFTEMMILVLTFVMWNWVWSWGWGWSIFKGGVPLWLCIIIPQPSKASIYLSAYWQ